MSNFTIKAKKAGERGEAMTLIITDSALHAIMHARKLSPEKWSEVSISDGKTSLPVEDFAVQYEGSSSGL